MLQYFLIAAPIAKSIERLTLEQIRDKILHFVRSAEFLLRGELQRLPLNVLHQLVLIPAKERCHAYNHLIYENADGPVVYHVVVATLFEHLWCEIFGGAAISLRNFIILKQTRQTEIYDLDISVRINHYVL